MMPLPVSYAEFAAFGLQAQGSDTRNEQQKINPARTAASRRERRVSLHLVANYPILRCRILTQQLKDPAG